MCAPSSPASPPAPSSRSARSGRSTWPAPTTRHRAPGWFDSSWELIRGLEVHEGLPFDARLHDWLRACLRVEPEPRVDATLAPRRAQPVVQHDPFSEFGIEGFELL